MSQPSYETPETSEEAHELIDDAGHGAKIAAGGQSLSLLLRQGLLDPEVIIDITSVPEFNSITATNDRVRIGATTTYSELGEHEIGSEVGVLGDAIEVIADAQVKNMGTIGGAVSHADPSLDIIPPLLCLDADIEVSSIDGSRTVPLREFSFGYMTTDLQSNELVEAITFDRPSGASAYEKHANVKGGWATVGTGAHVELSDGGDRIETARIALTAVADTAIRAPSVEAELEGADLTGDAIESAAEAVVADIDPLEDISGSVEYKKRLAVSLTKRAVTTAIERAGGMIQ